MLTKLVRATCLAAAIAASAPASAVIGTIDRVPAATLFFPYFEVGLDLEDPDRPYTVLGIMSATSDAALTRVTLWTNDGVPALAFHVYLTGFDLEQIDLRRVFAGDLPATAPANLDTSDTISPDGSQSNDVAYASCDASHFADLDAAAVDRLRAAFRGDALPDLPGQCAARPSGDDVVRGYVTVDVVNVCTTLFPGDPGYFATGAGVASNDNRLLGDFTLFEPDANSARGESAVHLEAATDGPTAIAGQPTFYGRFSGWDAADNREPLPTIWAMPYSALADDALVVWRDPHTARGPYACAAPPAPLPATRITAFDVAEDFVDLTTEAPAFGNVLARVGIDADLPIPFHRGWLRLNLRHATAGPASAPDHAQSYVLALHSLNACGTEGRFSGAVQAASLDNGDFSVTSDPPDQDPP